MKKECLSIATDPFCPTFSIRGNYDLIPSRFFGDQLDQLGHQSLKYFQSSLALLIWQLTFEYYCWALQLWRECLAPRWVLLG